MGIAANLDRVRAEMHETSRRAGRADGAVGLIAVSKLHPVECLLEAYSAGQRIFGENRVQEMQGKAEALHQFPDVNVHLIGPLQNNKTGRAAELFHSVDTLAEAKTANRLSAAAIALGKRLPVLIEVKLSAEPSKHGISPDELPVLAGIIASLDGLELRGLMTVPPWDEAAEASRPYFRQLRGLRDDLQRNFPSLVELSMGMSNDFNVAIEEGSTSIRVGTAIFGARVKTPVSEH